MYYFIDFVDNNFEGDLYQSRTSGDTLVGYVNTRTKNVFILVDCIGIVDLELIGARVSKILGEPEPYDVVTIYDF